MSASQETAQGWVALAGAGPGNEGLLTVRAAGLLGQAGLVVAGAELEPVARRYMSQDATLADPAEGAGSARALVQAAMSDEAPRTEEERQRAEVLARYWPLPLPPQEGSQLPVQLRRQLRADDRHDAVDAPTGDWRASRHGKVCANVPGDCLSRSIVFAQT